MQIIDPTSQQLNIHKSAEIAPYLAPIKPHHHRSSNKYIRQIKTIIPSSNAPNLSHHAVAHSARSYQLELFNRAKEQNIIAVLETGAGKTMISILLIKEMLSKERAIFNQATVKPIRRIVIFLVNIVPLVTQQSIAIAANVPFKVKSMIKQSSGKTLLDKDKIEKCISEFDVLVMTAQVFLNLLHTGLLSLDQVLLLVFDECHHTTKNHPYNQIMRNFYHPLNKDPSKLKPKIFSMTASPIKDGSNILLSAYELETALDSKVFTVSNYNDIHDYINRPDEIIYLYERTPSTYKPDKLIIELQKNCSGSKFINKLIDSSLEVLRNLGPWCALLLVRTALEDFFSGEESELVASLNDYTSDTSKMEESEINKAKKLYAQYKEAKTKSLDILTVDPSTLNDLWVAPKLKALFKALPTKTSKRFRSIVFVERRSTALTINFALKRVEALKHIRSCCILGHGRTLKMANSNMSFKRQNRIINSFRAGDLDLLVSTSVGEEGLDIQPCNLVMRFDFTESLVSYIQSRGRARKKRSKFVVFIEEGNADEHCKYESLQQSEKFMLEWSRSLPEDRIYKPFQDAEFEGIAAGHYDLENIFEIPTTKAIISLESSISLIYYYCAKLPRDVFCELVPVFKEVIMSGMYMATLILPPNCPIKPLQGQLAKTKALARQSAAFKTCIALYTAGQLDDNLMVVDNNDIDERDFDPKKESDFEKQIEGTWRALRDYTSKSPDLWGLECTDTYFINYIDISDINRLFGLNRFRSYAFVTNQKLPAFNAQVFFFKGIEAKLRIHSLNIPTHLSDSEMKQLAGFTLFSLYIHFGKEFETVDTHSPYFLVPLKIGSQLPLIDKSSIDWDLLADVSKRKVRSINEIKAGSIVVNRAGSGHQYYVKAIRYDLKVDSIIPDSIEVGDENTRETFRSYYKRRHRIDLQDDQIIFEVEKVHTTLHFLQKSFKQPKSKGRAAKFTVSQYCTPFIMPGDVLRTSMLIPSILKRTDSLLLIKEIKNKLAIPEVEDELILEAFTLTSANVAMDYERLELLGDSFLKFITTTNLYINFPLKHEGQMHCRRLRIIGNRFLYYLSRDLNLPKYVTHQPFNKTKYSPAGFRIKENTHPTNLHNYTMADKALADIVEATLGAGVLAGKEHGGLKCALALGIPLDGFTDWQSIQALKPTPLHVDTNTVRSKLNFEAIEATIGYKFKDPIWLVEAFTHASLVNASTPCYQRLEFLGDAILDYFVVSYLFEKYPNNTPGELTEVKDACVSNNTLAAIMEQLGLYKHILHFSGKLMNAIQHYTSIIQTMREDGVTANQKEYWYDLKAPKVISDVFEATLGAVFVDSNFDVASVHQIFIKIIQPVYDYHLAPNRVIVHPYIQLNRYTNRMGCDKIQIFQTIQQGEEVDVNKRMTCSITVHGVKLSEQFGKVSKQARKYAAQEVLDKFKKDPDLLNRLCDCPYKKSRECDDHGDDQDSEEE